MTLCVLLIYKMLAIIRNRGKEALQYKKAAFLLTKFLLKNSLISLLKEAKLKRSWDEVEMKAQVLSTKLWRVQTELQETTELKKVG